jgi:hypothetical protein
MRIVNIVSGLAVLLTTLAFAHLLHPYFVNAGEAAHSPPFLAGMAIGAFLHRKMFAAKTGTVMLGTLKGEGCPIESEKCSLFLGSAHRQREIKHGTSIQLASDTHRAPV